MLGTSAMQGFGEIEQGYLESSNVDVVEEMVNMIVAQRAYEINSKTIKTVEEMLGMANNLKRG
jgi:flagellar basal-body rod protein FlgG